MIKEAVDEGMTVKDACEVLGVSRAGYYRSLKPKRPRAARRCARALSQKERLHVLKVLTSSVNVDRSVAEVHAHLLDQGQYLCSPRTMYRILEAHKAVRERRAQRRHPEYKKPELLATGPNQLWSWDITKLKGPGKYQHYFLYVIMDVYSRFVVGWMVAERESKALAQRLIAETCAKQGIQPGQLTLHADRGPSMRSKEVAQLLATLNVTKTHSRPHVSNDNPYSEAQFKTLKYAPNFPGSFGSLEDTREFLQPFFAWYNHEHYHSGINMLTPAQVHTGQADQVLRKRQQVLERAYASHPNRFVKGPPKAGSLPAEVWINKPEHPKKDFDGLKSPESSRFRRRSHPIQDRPESGRAEGTPPEILEQRLKGASRNLDLTDRQVDD